MLKDPSTKYTHYASLDLENRQWPTRKITKHPIWLSTDLRDGNQALARPMTADQKLFFFRHLVKCNFKEIEVSFPSASDTDFEFVRTLIRQNEVPDDVWIQVLTPAREELIRRTFESVAGARHVILHIYTAAAPCFREIVFSKTKEEMLDIAVRHIKIVRELADEYNARYGTKFRLAYGVEAFSQTEPEYVIEICTAAKNAWGLAGPGDRRVTFNLPSTVEIAPPSHFADQIEYFCTHMQNRDEMIVSLHTHNDRGTAVAATELAMMAGADRVEGCLFGNGERCGNVDLVTLALNLYSQGTPCGLDFSQIQSSIDVVLQCTSIPVHPRHPYAGELVFTAFSGSHQDAIKKGFEAQERRHAECAKAGLPLKWEMPYLPLDPADIGRTYEAVIRVNSQSGKGGSAYIVGKQLHMDLPRSVQQEFYQIVQQQVDRYAQEMSPGEIKAAFCESYYIGDAASQARLTLDEFAVVKIVRHGNSVTTFHGRVSVDGNTCSLSGEGADPVYAFLAAVEKRLGLAFSVIDHHERKSTGPNSKDLTSFLLLTEHRGLACGDEVSHAPSWGVGVDEDYGRCGIRAAVSAINRQLGQRPVSIASGDSKEVIKILQEEYRLPIPRALDDMVSDFCTKVDKEGLSPAQVAARFISQFCHGASGVKSCPLASFSIGRRAGVGAMYLHAIVQLHGMQEMIFGSGNDAASCLLEGLAEHLGPMVMREFHVRPRDSGGYSAFIKVEREDQSAAAWGIGNDADTTAATLQATVIAAENATRTR